MGMKLPIAATSIVCSACIAASVAAPAVGLPEKSVKGEATRIVTQEYKLLAITDPVTGVITLIAVPLQDLGKINKFFVDNLLSPLFTLASATLNIPTQISNQVPPETAINNNITVPIGKLEAFPAGLAALIQDIFGGASTFAVADSPPGSNVALAAAPGTDLVSLVSPIADLGKINKFFADNLLSPAFTLASSPLNIPTQISNQVPPETAIENNITKPIAKLEGLPAGFADLVRDIIGGSSGFAASEAAQFTTDPTAGPRTLSTNADLGKTDPTARSNSSITDVPGSVTGTGAPQRKPAPRLVNLGLDSTDRTDAGGRHRLENLGNLASSWTPPTRKLNGKRDSAESGGTVGATSGSNPSGSGQPSSSNPQDNGEK